MVSNHESLLMKVNDQNWEYHLARSPPYELLDIFRDRGYCSTLELFDEVVTLRGTITGLRYNERLFCIDCWKNKKTLSNGDIENIRRIVLYSDLPRTFNLRSESRCKCGKMIEGDPAWIMFHR